MFMYLKVCLLLFISSSVTLSAAGQRRLPSLRLENLKGEIVNTAALPQNGRPIVLTFWSTTCKPCLQELEAFTEQWEKWQDERRFEVLAVSTDDSRSLSKVRAYVAANEWPFTILVDKNQDLKRAMNVNAIPHLFIFDQKGNLVYSRVGYNPGGENKVMEIIRNL